ncbi:MAG: hypothetical protein K8T20_16155 [Planctomycetes bacterium]|nr:hypothetical protein [Planctomycetota bacterium]
MGFPRFAVAACASLLLVSAASAADTILTGTVVDADGKPVAGAEVGSNWQFGDETRAYDAVKTAEDGTFSLTIRYYHPPTAILAMDAAHERGAAVVVVEADAVKPQALTLAPLVTVKGTFACTDPTVTPNLTSVQWQFGKARCGNAYATEPGWSVKLPPGAWGFWIYNPELGPFTKEFEIPSGGKELDLGVLKVAPTFLSGFYGKELPKWKVSDARGAEKTVQISDFKGKWVLVEFWGFW